MDDQRIKDFAIVTAISAILLFLGVSSLGLFLIFFTIPQMVLGYKRNYIDMILSLIISFTVLLPIYPGSTTIIVLILFAVWSSSIIYSLKNKYSYIKTVLISTAVMAILVVGALILINKIKNIDLLSNFRNEIDIAFKKYLEIINNSGKINMEVIDNLYKNIQVYLLVCSPAILMILTFFYSLINATLLTFVLRKMKIENLEAYKFSEFELPSNFLIGVLLSFISIAIVKYMEIDLYEEAYLNIILIYSTLIGVEGMAVSDFFFKLRRSVIFRFLMPIMIIFVFRAYQIYIIIGLANLIFKFREKYRKERINK